LEGEKILVSKEGGEKNENQAHPEEKRGNSIYGEKRFRDSRTSPRGRVVNSDKTLEK